MKMTNLIICYYTRKNLIFCILGTLLGLFSLYILGSLFYKLYLIDAIRLLAESSDSLYNVFGYKLSMISPGGFDGSIDSPVDPLPGVKCPKCAEKGIETWVLPGKHCPKCSHPC